MVVLAITISSSCNYEEAKVRCLSEKLDLDKKNELVIYNHFFTYKFNELEFVIDSIPESKEIDGNNFRIRVLKHEEEITSLFDPKISLRYNSRNYYGNGISNKDNWFPPKSNFCYWLDENYRLTFNKKNQIYCEVVEYLNMREYKEKVLGIKR